MSLKDAIAAFNAAVVRVIQTEPSLSRAKDTDALTDGSTATTIRAAITKVDCKLGNVENFDKATSDSDYPNNATVYAEKITYISWVRKIWEQFNGAQLGATTLVATANTPLALTSNAQFGSIGTSVVYGAAELAAAKAYEGANKPLILVDLQTKEVWTRANTSSAFTKDSEADWKTKVNPNWWYTDQANQKLIYIACDYSYVVF